MGRITTDLAARFVDADNLPDKSKLPQISVIDALLPFGGQKLLSSLLPASLKRSQADSKPLDPNVRKHTFVKYYEVHKNGDGKKNLIAHKGQLGTGESANSGGEKELAKGNSNDKQGGGDQSNADLTPEEDAKLRELKAANQSWKNIAAEMNKGLGILKKRWKEIEHGPDAPAQGGGQGQDNDGKDQNKPSKKQQEGKGKTTKDNEPDWKNMIPSEKRREGEKRKAAKNAAKDKDEKDAQPAKKEEHEKTSRRSAKATLHSARKIEAPKSSKAGSEARFTMQEWLTLQQDEMFSFDELRFLAELLTQRPDSTWDRVAARFFDKTGRRVHPMDIRDKFEEISKMQ